MQNYITCEFVYMGIINTRKVSRVPCVGEFIEKNCILTGSEVKVVKVVHNLESFIAATVYVDKEVN